MNRREKDVLLAARPSPASVLDRTPRALLTVLMGLTPKPIGTIEWE